MKVVYVTRGQVMAARLIVKRAEARGKPVRESVRKIAEAKTVYLPWPKN